MGGDGIMPVKYEFGENKEFIIEDYDKAKTFAGFLPGIAGVHGIPMWSFYVNRGQAMGSFGVRDKNGAIMEFLPAVVMYRNIEHQGFRTFIKKNGVIHEIFSSASTDDKTRKLIIEKNIIKIAETNKTLNLQITVTYFTMPGESYAALVRKVEIANLGNGAVEIEILDGLPQILPAGVGNTGFQTISNLIKAWFDVYNAENGIVYYKVRGSIADSAEVGTIRGGNFYLSFSSESDGLIPPIFDMDVIFGGNTALTRPDGWESTVEELYKKKQVPENKVSGAFSAAKTMLSDKFVLCSVFGYTPSLEYINSRKSEFTMGYMAKKEKEAGSLVDALVEDVYTRTSDKLFDRYIEQCYLDNIIRGGYPLIFGTDGKNHVYHVFSRKHGDLEREYNFFSLEPALYSQGNGNFRDVSQNRRNDVLVKPGVGDFNVKHFMSLIQADGYNPLLVKGCTFSFDQAASPEILELVCTDQDGISRLLKNIFTPGSLISFITERKTVLKVTREAFLEKVLSNSRQNFEAEFGEGYWSDHWTYNMDLVDSYLAVYPDRKKEILFEDRTYRYFYSPVYVLPRADKYVITGGKVRQYGALFEEDSLHSGGSRGETDWLRTDNGAGGIYETGLFEKLVSLALIKFASLDPLGMGLEMEAGRPGWNDAMNGLPGLFGSGLGETVELKRIVTFLISTGREFDEEICLHTEAAGLLTKIERLLDGNLSGELDDFSYWDRVSDLKEEYRSKIRFGIEGTEESFSTKALVTILEKFDKKLEIGLEKSLIYGNGIYPTYFTYNAEKYEIIEGKRNPANGYQNVKITEFECKPLPVFLEGPARVLKTMEAGNEAAKLYEAVKASGIYDRKLKMYKTSVPLDGTDDEAGRIMAFTPGWLERESVFLHMEYKYLYAVLKAELYEQFFKDLKTMFVPFMEPEIYGRCTIENSSFIASSVNPDPALHGRGFVARLSGTTAEALTMWFTMMAGKEVFRFEAGKLALKLEPVLPGRLFDENGTVSFKFLGKTLVTYINPKRADTYGKNGVKPVRYVLSTFKNEVVEINDPIIGAPYAEQVRNGEVAKIDVFME